jgi:hypothetical protein
MPEARVADEKSASPTTHLACYPRAVRTPRTASRPALRAAAAAALACAALVLVACTPATARFGFDVRVHLTPAVHDGVMVVNLPAARPSDGVEVRPSRGPAFHIPPGHYPPPGQCRVWLPGVPPGQQSRPGPCGVLRQQVPPGAYLVAG